MKSSKSASIRKAYGEETRIIFVSGTFNVLHPGHVRLLRFANELGDCLVVGLNSDCALGVQAASADRLEGVASNRFVTEAFVMDEHIEDVLRSLRPAIVVKGREHENLPNVEENILKEIGGKLLFSSGEMLRSSFLGIEDEIDPRQTPFLPNAYMTRHNITTQSLLESIKKCADLRVIVIGDLIVDDYIECDPLGMSQEDPTLVIAPRQTTRFVGGAGIVAAHGMGLGAQVTFLSVTGIDDVAKEAKRQMDTHGVLTILLQDETRPTTLKQRFRASGKTLLRVSNLLQRKISVELSDQLLAQIDHRINETDLIILSDFNYGCLPDELVLQIIQKARDSGVMIVADSQASSQIGDISRFQGVALITPTELEARLAVSKDAENLVVLGKQLLHKAECNNMIMTLGAEGVLISTQNIVNDQNFSTDRINALNPKPQDVAGAGDSLFCTASISLTAGSDIWSAALLGSIAAACQVSRVGNIPISAEEIVRVIESGSL